MQPLIPFDEFHVTVGVIVNATFDFNIFASW